MTQFTYSRNTSLVISPSIMFEAACDLNTAERLNIAADELVGSTSCRPINFHINTPFALYLDVIYFPNHYRNKIRSTSGKSEAREFLKDKYQWNNRLIDSIEWDIVSSFISKQTYATRKTMTKYSHRWMLSNSKTIDNHIICSYCHQSEDNLDHDHFLTCNDSDERKEVRIKRFQQLLTQLQTPIALTSTLIKVIKTAYREQHQSTSQIPLTQQDIIGWNHFIRGRISKEPTNTMTNFCQTLIQTKQRFTGIGWTKAVIKFMLEIHVYE